MVLEMVVLLKYSYVSVVEVPSSYGTRPVLHSRVKIELRMKANEFVAAK